MDNNNMMNNGPDGQFNSNNQYNGALQGNPAPQYYGNGQYNPNDPFTMNGSYDPNAQYGMPDYNQPYQSYQPYQGNIYAQPGESNSANGKAVASLVCGIFSLLLCCCYGVPAIILGIIAIVLAVLSKKDNMGQMPGMAVAGLVLGIIGIVMGVIYILVLILAVAEEGMYAT